MKRTMILFVVLLLAVGLLWVRDSNAIPITGVGAATLHVRSFEMWDTLGFGFTFGRYESGIPECVIDPVLGFFHDCGSNGYWFLDGVTVPLRNGTGIEAVYWFNGPAYDLNGVAIPGTEDDFVKITATVGIAFTGIFFPEHSFHILNLVVEGSSLQFENGIPIDSLSFTFADFDEQQIAEGTLLFTPEGVEGFYGFFQGVPFPSTMRVDDLFQIFYQQEYEFKELRPIINIPVPEPGFAMMIPFGVAALVAAGRKRGIR